ncbi:metallophosphoesterase family protein [Novisyntrophococcus fermenticellae]|uniref:metallophosphoesterase family protein n=1 Tax=Novisyntrophococcus fermenticellae TaxID=2068655 RepID=UPI001E33C5B1|nr:metallophosphoesterase [Novisyntrophococcus fermenticellae]
MKNIRFAHLSDTHILKDYDNVKLKEIFTSSVDPVESLRNCLRGLQEQSLDFVLITGDLVHEGVSSDYAFLKELIESELKNTKIVYVLGNHDHKQAFRTGMKFGESDEACFYTTDVDGLRIIVLDSAVEGNEEGSMSKEQEDWLAGVLKDKSERGSIVAFHHPVIWSNEQLAMKVSERFLSLLKNSDVIGVFCGHTHYNSLDSADGMTQYTADSTAFGIAFHPSGMGFTNKTGYGIYTLGDRNISMHTSVITPETNEYTSFTFADIMAAAE